MNSYLLPIHFEILDGKHEVNSVTLNTFIESYKEIFEGFFETKIEIQIGLPEEGGWKSSLKLSIKDSILPALILSAGIPLLTGYSIEDLGKNGHQKIIKFINHFITQEARNTSEEYPRKCLEQKNKIYQQFQKDGCVTAFDLDDIPTIPRNNFNLYIKELLDENPLDCGEAKITVHSPVWKGSRRSWKGKIDTVEGNETAFDFDKDLTGKFWEKIKLNEIIPTAGNDVMIVQLIKRTNNKPLYRVIRVLSYNGKEIDSPLNEKSISRITSGVLEKFNDVRDDDLQMNLF